VRRNLKFIDTGAALTMITKQGMGPSKSQGIMQQAVTNVRTQSILSARFRPRVCARSIGHG
jgi:hypothetical protein